MLPARETKTERVGRLGRKQVVLSALTQVSGRVVPKLSDFGWSCHLTNERPKRVRKTGCQGSVGSSVQGDACL